MIDVIVAVPHEYGFHAGLRIDSSGQRTRNLQRDVFLACLAAADSARIMAAVSGVDRDDDIAAGMIGLGGRLNRVQAAAALQVDDEAVAVLVVGARGVAPRSNGLVEVEHDA